MTNFWSFLFVISGLVDIVISLLCFSGVLPVKGFSLTVFLVCLAIGLTYFGIGIAIAAVRWKKAKGKV